MGYGRHGSRRSAVLAILKPRHTWFFALRPGVEDAVRLHTYAGNLLLSHGVVGKQISAERLHVTLEVVGHDVDEDTVERACRAADAVHSPAVEVSFDAVMTFAAPSVPFVFVGGAGLDQVRAMRGRLVDALIDFGFAPSHVYEPHMTLCYSPRRRMARFFVVPIGFRVAEFALLKSHVGFSRHEVVRTWPLRAGL